jgi:hypothetical protein
MLHALMNNKVLSPTHIPCQSDRLSSFIYQMQRKCHISRTIVYPVSMILHADRPCNTFCYRQFSCTCRSLWGWRWSLNFWIDVNGQVLTRRQVWSTSHDREAAFREKEDFVQPLAQCKNIFNWYINLCTVNTQ